MVPIPRKDRKGIPMTLYKQIMLVMSMLVLLLLATSMFINYKNAESFIQDQLLSNAENTASSLGVAIGHVHGDKAMEETLINAIFDSGYYESIVLTDIDNNTIYDRREPVKVLGIPSWFTHYVKLRASEATVPLSSNWRMIGHLKIKGHRGHAYGQLWHAFKEMIIGFLMLGLFAVIGIYIFLKIILRPLNQVRKQAEAVMQRHFIYQDPLPKTKEMHDVASAMNALVKKVKKVYDKEAKAIANYKKLLYEDSETGYFNRSYFRIKLQDYLHSSDYFSHGHVLAFSIHDYPKLLEEEGINGVHKAIMQLQASIDKYCDTSFSEAICCRTRENDIMIILPSSRREDVENLARNVCKACIDNYQVNCAYVSYKERELLTEILKRVDSALMMTASTEDGYIRLYADVQDNIPVLSHDEWIKKIYEALDTDAFIPMLQPVVDEYGEIVQNELLLRLNYEDKIVSAGLFMPIIAGVKMLSVLDRYVLERLERLQTSKPLAVNITHDFISHSANFQLITSLSKRWRKAKIDIIFELPNTTIASDPEASKAFVSHIQKEGWELGIDHFSVGDYDLELLEILKPAYLKINATYLLSLLEGKEEKTSNASLLILTELLEIDLIAIAIDSEDTARRLKENGIIFMQGFWIAEPKEEKRT